MPMDFFLYLPCKIYSLPPPPTPYKKIHKLLHKQKQPCYKILIRETNWKVQLLRNTQIVWSYPPYNALFSTRRYVYLTIILPFLISP